MRLSIKFTGLLTLVLCVVLMARGWLDARRTIAPAYDELRAEQRAYAEAIRSGVSQMWRQGGPELAALWLREINRDDADAHVRLVWLLEPEREEAQPFVGRERVVSLLDRATIAQFRDAPQGEDNLYTYARLSLGDGAPNAIEIERSLAPQRAYVEGVVRNEVVTGIVVLLVYAVAAGIIGIFFVGRPVQGLIAQAVQLGEGRFTTAAPVWQHDEIGRLAQEMNRTALRLQAARDRADAEREAREAAEVQLQHADRLASVGVLAAGLIHDLGTPLNVISGRASMIGACASSDEIQENAAIITKQSQRMAAMIKQLLAFARRGDTATGTPDVLAVAREHLELIEPVARKSKVRLVVAADSEPVHADVPVTALRQVFNNLVMNGVQAMGQGGTLTVRTGTVPASSSTSLDYAYFSVEDEGPGIADEHLPRIFEPFYTTKPAGEGTGLGLAVSQALMRAHGGWIEVDTKPGRGTRFAAYFRKTGG